MRLSNAGLASMTLSLSGVADATRAGAYVFGCLWLPQQPNDPFTVSWTAGGSEDSCMVKSGVSTKKIASEQGLNCASIGWVEANESYSFPCGCKCRESRWNLSYKTANGVSYSGDTTVQWKTGPYNTEVILRGQSPGTHICPSESRCSKSSFEWSHERDARVYVVFEPLSSGASVFTIQGEDLELDQLDL
ncbi:unnamed protein product [Clonostachys rosea f. rosea IK726]|uniref:Uncharacterized protein n=1 Tax=Clonostachys rosea f. rosea IK726 TaxID=1349383 RepID=A0ACA9TLZ6_BIOOC|nr:unnamed protein product [Clonostachys rosea f. rosea IK726]